MSTEPRSAAASAHAPATDEASNDGSTRGRPWVTRALILVLLILLAALGLVVALYFFPMREQLEHTRTALTAEEQESSDLAARVAELDAQLAQLVERTEAMTAELEALRAGRAEVEAQLETLRAAKEALEEQLQAEIARGDVAVTGEGGLLTVNVADRVLFPSGSAQLSNTGKAVLRRVAGTLRSLDDRVIEITGHTDSAPLSPSLQETFATNWELSTARATNVVRFLQDECEVPGERLVARGRASYAPVATNRSARGRQRNRRIELTLAPRPSAAVDE